MTTADDSVLKSLRIRLRDELTARTREHACRLEWSRDQLAEHQRVRLRALLAHAVDRSGFHRRRLRGIDPDRVGVGDLTALPVMTKSEMMASFDEIVTDRRLDRRTVEDHLAASRAVPRLLLDDYVCLASGGSSGERGVFVQTVSEYADFVASLMRRAMAKMAAAGGPPPDGLVIGLVAAGSPVHSTGFGAATAGGAVRIVSVPATLPLEVIVEQLNAAQPPALMGYPTKLAQLAGEQLAGRLHIIPSSITTTSEMLTVEDRGAITAAFGVPVTNQFASTEGLVGHTAPGGSTFTFASDMCIAELVDEHDQLVDDGATAAKVLVTNLHNFSQPLIRYELTDRFVRQPPGADGHLRADVGGRADELFRYGPVVLHPLAVRTVMATTPAVSEYQVRQTERGIHLDTVATSTVDDAALASALEQSLRRAGLVDPVVSVGLVDRIERHPDTGKAPRFIPLGSP